LSPSPSIPSNTKGSRKFHPFEARQRRLARRVDALHAELAHVTAGDRQAAAPVLEAGRVAQPDRVIRMPVRAAARALHVEPEQHETRRAPQDGEVHRLVAAVPAGVDPARVGAETGLVDRLDAVHPRVAGQRRILRPTLAGELEGVGVLSPPLRIAAVEHVGPRSEAKTAVDGDYLPRFAVVFAPVVDRFAVVGAEAGAACDADDVASSPAAGSFPLFAGSGAILFDDFGAALPIVTRPRRSKSSASACGISIDTPRFALIVLWSKSSTGVTVTDAISISFEREAAAGWNSPAAAFTSPVDQVVRLAFLMNASGR
jgi:hypothetical protein